MPVVAASIEHFLRDFVTRYGVDSLRQLVTDLRRNASTAEVAFRFGVDQRTARLWRERIGAHMTVFVPHPAVEKAIEERANAATAP